MAPLLELFVVLVFVVGWLVLEAVGRRLDREKEERERASQVQSENRHE